MLIRTMKMALVLAAAGILSGCALCPQPPPATAVPAPPETLQPETGWHSARFRFDWPEGAEPAWHRDLLLAHRVAAPVIERRKARIPLWRFHRRAVRDDGGHQFSILFYTDAATASEVMAALAADPLLTALQRKKIVNRVRYSAPFASRQPAVGDASDRQWSPAVQRTWPHFIMGASRMWLGLIEEAAGRDPGPVPEDPEALEDFYQQVEAEVTAAWRREGRHALLHHLNALFGYGPVEVWEMNLMRF